MSQAKVAVITRTKDRPQFLLRAMDSVLSQNFSDWVHVIVNDGGDPNLVETLALAKKEAYAGRIQIIHHETSQGMQNASNAGIEGSQSEYLIIHDDDDSWEKEFLELTVNFLEEKGPTDTCQGVVTQTTQVFEEINSSGEILYQREQPYYPFGLVGLDEMRRRNLFAPIAFLYRRAVHEKVGLFRQEFDVLGDHDFNLRFLRRFDIGVLPEFKARYHWRNGSMGNTVTRGLETHRSMLTKMKNAYHREWLDNPQEAVGSIDEIPLPPPQYTVQIPFRKRTEECCELEEMPDFLEDWKFDVLSLDLFDTVLRRTCARPKDLFKLLEQQLIQEDPRFANFALLRELAEKSARGKEGKEVSLDEIYKVVADWLKLSKKEASSMMTSELELEKSVLYLDSQWKDLIEKAEAAGKKIVFISDMYLPLSFLKELLESLGISDPEIFLSLEMGASKHEGKLFSKVVEALNCSAESILHIGDNHFSDYVRAREAGLQAFHWTEAYRRATWISESGEDFYERKDLLSSFLSGSLDRLRHQLGAPISLLGKLGREVAGPLYYSFFRWIVKEAKEDGIKNVILLGRDGYYWEKLLDKWGGAKQAGIRYSYLHASRKVLNYASFEELDERALTFLLTPNPSLTAYDFLDRAGLDSSQYDDLLKSVGFEDPKEVLTNEMGGRYLKPGTRQKLRSLFLVLRKELEALFANERKGMQKLLAEAGFNRKDSAIVDIGWNASSVRSVDRIVGSPSKHKVHGYFFGTWAEAEPKEDEAVVVKSYFMHFGKSEEKATLLRESINWLESINSAPFPTLLSLKVEAEAVEPVFSENLETGFLGKEQEEIWSGVLEFVGCLSDLDKVPYQNFDGHIYLYLTLHRLLREPSPEETKAWGGMSHSEGFGLEVYKKLIEPISKSTSGPELLDAYKGSNWKRGFLSSLTDEQRQYVLDRIGQKVVKTYEQLKGDLEWKTQQADEFWSEKEKAKSEIAEWKAKLEKTQGDLKYDQAKLARAEQERQLLFDEREAVNRERRNLSETLEKLRKEKAEQEQENRVRVEQLEEQLENLNLRSQGLEEKLSAVQADFAKQIEATDEVQSELDSLQEEADGMRKVISSRWLSFKAFLSGKMPKL